jgi:outer membrane protein TolC
MTLMSPYLRAALASLVVVSPVAAQSALTETPSGVVLSLGEAVRLATRQNVNALAAAARVDQARARADAQRAQLLPVINATGTEGERTFNSASFGISFPSAPGQPSAFPPEGKVLGPIRSYDARVEASMKLLDISAIGRIRSARASANAAAADADQTIQLVAAQTAIGYLRVIRGERLVVARLADSTLAEDLVQIARDQVKAGVGIAVDVTRSESQRAATRAALIAARSERDRARLELLRYLALPLNSSLVLTDTLAPPSANDGAGENEAVRRAFAQRADLKAVAAQLDAQRLQVNAIFSEYFPTISAFADKGAQGAWSSRMLNTYDWGVKVTVPLFDGFKHESRAAEAKALLRELNAKERDMHDQVSIEVRGALLDLNSAREQVDAASLRLKLSEQELSQTRERLTAGVTGNTEVITATTNVLISRTQLVDALTTYQAARIGLLRVQGAITDLR